MWRQGSNGEEEERSTEGAEVAQTQRNRFDRAWSGKRRIWRGEGSMEDDGVEEDCAGEEDSRRFEVGLRRC